MATGERIGTSQNIPFEEHGSGEQIVFVQQVDEVPHSGPLSATAAPLLKQQVNAAANRGTHAPRPEGVLQQPANAHQ